MNLLKAEILSQPFLYSQVLLAGRLYGKCVLRKSLNERTTPILEFLKACVIYTLHCVYCFTESSLSTKSYLMFQAPY